MDKEQLEEVLRKHTLWIRGDPKGERANLCGESLSGADLSEADLDFSCWPLWCGSLHAKIDRRIAAQLAYHLVSAMKHSGISNRVDLVDLANECHMSKYLRIEKDEEATMTDVGQRALHLFKKYANTEKLWDERVALRSGWFTWAATSDTFIYLRAGRLDELTAKGVKMLVELLEPYETREFVTDAVEADRDATIKALKAEVEQLHTQLAGCGTAAQGDAWKRLAMNTATKGSYGWSDSYEQVIKMVTTLLLTRDYAEHLEWLLVDAGRLDSAGITQLRKDFSLKEEE